MGRKIKTAIRVGLDVPADWYQVLAVLSVRKCKSVAEYVMDLLHEEVEETLGTLRSEAQALEMPLFKPVLEAPSGPPSPAPEVPRARKRKEGKHARGKA